MVIDSEKWEEVKRIYIEIDKLAERFLYSFFPECKDKMDEAFAIIDEVERNQGYEKVDI